MATAQADPNARSLLAAENAQTFHVHFGADKDGLGLLLSAIDQSECDDFAILQRPVGDWKNLLYSDHTAVQVAVNGREISSELTLAYGPGVGLVQPGAGPYLLIEEYDVKRFASFINRTTSFSCSLKDIKDVAHILSQLPERENPPRLYVVGDQRTLQGTADKLVDKAMVVPIKTDRICDRVLITPSGKIKVQAELWKGHIVVMPEVPPGKTPDTTPKAKISEGLAKPGTIPIHRVESSSSESSSEASLAFAYASDELPPEGEAKSSSSLSERYETKYETLPFGGAAVVAIDNEARAREFALKKLDLSAEVLKYTMTTCKLRKSALKSFEERLENVLSVINRFRAEEAKVPNIARIVKSNKERPEFVVVMLRQIVEDLKREISTNNQEIEETSGANVADKANVESPRQRIINLFGKARDFVRTLGSIVA